MINNTTPLSFKIKKTHRNSVDTGIQILFHSPHLHLQNHTSSQRNRIKVPIERISNNSKANRIRTVSKIRFTPISLITFLTPRCTASRASLITNVCWRGHTRTHTGVTSRSEIEGSGILRDVSKVSMITSSRGALSSAWHARTRLLAAAVSTRMRAAE